MLSLALVGIGVSFFKIRYNAALVIRAFFVISEMCLLKVRWLSSVIPKYFIDVLHEIVILLILILLRFLEVLPNWIAEDIYLH